MSSTVQPPTERPQGAGSAQALNTVQLLDALRSYNETTSPTETKSLISLLQSFPSLSSAHPRTSSNRPTPLHLAIRCARVQAIPLILDHRPTDLNARDVTGSTPLHLACSLGRTDIVAALLAQPEIDDMIKDEEGKTCLERAKSGDVARLIQTSRNQFNQTYLEHLSEYINNGSAEGLMGWLQRRRSRCIDYSAKMPTGSSKGTTVLHEAARRRDLALLNLCLDRGADVLVRDGRGKSPIDYAKDEKVKAWFKQAIVAEGAALKSTNASVSDQSAFSNSSSLPVRKGYLEKWTNLAKGYKQRWFVLNNGQLTYYRHQEEENRASRGTIMLQHAKVTGLNEDKLKFEISSDIAKFKFYCKADHPLEAVRWVEDLRTHIEAATSNGQTASAHRMSTASIDARDDSAYGASSNNSLASANPTPNTSQLDLSNTSATAKRQSKIGALKNRALNRPDSSSNLKSVAANPLQPTTAPEVPSRYDTFSPAPRSVNQSIAGADDTDNASLLTFAGELDDGARPPHEESFALLATSAKAQVEAAESLVASLDHTSSTSIDVKTALKQSLKRLNTMLDEYSDQVTEREKWYLRRFERETQTRKLWEDSMKQVAVQHEELEHELHKETLKGTRRKKELKEARLELMNSPAKTNASTTLLFSNDQEAGSGSPPAQLPSPSTAINPTSPTSAGLQTPTRARTMDFVSVSDDEDDDEFFEAVESGALPVKVDTPIQSPNDRPWPAHFDVDKAKLESMAGYRTLRTSLPITVDDRPSVSLWGILKNSIGKDLTKISFPVSFNEPTSMLERMAEDMEFSECLDAAAAAPDSTTRIAYVAAFAMSNYSSTIGRIAKPFNPMLGETFEYARFDKHYRYMSEQVSHHPPISACISESPDWKYYGEVDAKNKFMGKSFEIRPTGIAHCELRLPEEWGPDYPKDGRGKAMEHYSWRKVTTSVSNFIMGTPIIDHSGDMTITNHRTGDTCVLTFKPRGWRGSNSCEIKGQVTDAEGRKIWDIAGRWNSQLVARRAGASPGDLKPDEDIPRGEHAEYLLLWKNSEQPPNSPFNLTPYAITLNEKKPSLTPWLPPTDCRLRPDLHAFESGHFEQANDYKTGLEQLQRKTRQQRETGGLAPHQARWFTRQIDPDTGEGYWEPKRINGTDLEYFEERFRVGHAREQGEEASWQGVDSIFGDFALL